MSTFSVVSPGPLTTFQDAGRIGHHAIGLTEGGPMDFRSFAIANRLVENDINSTALEITFGGLILKCLKPTTLCLTGAYAPLFINGKAKPLWQTHQVNSGDEIKIGFAGIGVRSYLAVSGGFDSPRWFNSSATVIRESLGQALQKGDSLTALGNAKPANRLHYLKQASLRKQITLRFIAGYQWQHLTAAEQAKFLACDYQISPRNDRMGYQLEGDAIDSGIEKIYSEGISKGTIQLPGNGQPIILMNDRQTIGGYPKLGSVISADLDRLSQLTAGASVRFIAISPEQAIREFNAYSDEIEHIRFEALTLSQSA
ncbi:biotin-dependent carboxyltransferase family protein [Reinekea thalattae]|uniref:Biotin-dependent carboxyltransferase n=1 Tax=Reinekea thalattae TaxID=2593301 RepID=A0A5C8Z2G1_9GAMM|nr:biotin-dependent carboxyltransferase family protein [Reinekea thalattae]TXR51421.1 biotin-dependent carboxyltransferase [Reinekea thalattae]